MCFIGSWSSPFAAVVHSVAAQERVPAETAAWSEAKRRLQKAEVPAEVYMLNSKFPALLRGSESKSYNVHCTVSILVTRL